MNEYTSPQNRARCYAKLPTAKDAFYPASTNPNSPPRGVRVWE